MNLKLSLPVVAIVVLGVGASVTARARDTATPQQQVYTVTAVSSGLVRDPAAWAGRTVLVRGDLHFTIGATPAAMPLVVMTMPPQPHVSVGAFDLTQFLQRLERRGTQGQVDGLMLTQAHTSRQRLDFTHAGTYHLRLSLTQLGPYHNVPSGEIV